MAIWMALESYLNRFALVEVDEKCDRNKYRRVSSKYDKNFRNILNFEPAGIRTVFMGDSLVKIGVFRKVGRVPPWAMKKEMQKFLESSRGPG